jgi:ribosomal protein S6E (S10)
MAKRSEGEIYRTLLRRQTKQLRKIADTLRDPKVQDRFERLVLDIAGGSEGQTRQMLPDHLN